MSTMRFDIITIFPKIFSARGGSAFGGDSYGYFGHSIIKRAVQKKKIQIKIHNLRDFTKDKHKQVDDKPYGGGAGMVLMAEPILRAVKSLGGSTAKLKVVILSAKGKQFTQKMACDWQKKYKNIVLISGRYEGIDERVKTILKAEEVSIGPYVTTDGDVAAMVIVSAITRLIPNVINRSSLEDESFLRKRIKEKAATKKLEYPHYTRPEVLKYTLRQAQGKKIKKYRVPEVLLSGDHKKIEEWRQKNRS
jgi:tRNA (guanine37-N1)-methyltransferase